MSKVSSVNTTTMSLGTTVFSSLSLGYNKLTPENREQNDYQMFGGPLYEAQQQTDGENQTAEEPVDDYEHSRHAGHDHRNHFERRGTLNFLCNISCFA